MAGEKMGMVFDYKLVFDELSTLKEINISLKRIIC